MSEIAVRHETLTELRAVLSEGSIAEIQALLPDDVSPSRFLQVANTAARTNPDLAKADKVSLFSALVKCASAGLMPDGEEAALAAFNNKVTFMPMVGGYRKVAGLHGWSLTGHVVYENDDFDYELGETPWVKHRPAPLGSDRGAERGAYAVAIHRDGTRKIEVMSIGQVNEIAARASNKTLWKPGTHSRIRMIEKTPAKALAKRLPYGEKESVRLRALLEENGAADPKALMYGEPAAPVVPSDVGREVNVYDAVTVPDKPPAPEPEPEFGEPAPMRIPGGPLAGMTIPQAAVAEYVDPATGEVRPGIGWLKAVLEFPQIEQGDPFRVAVVDFLTSHETTA